MTSSSCIIKAHRAGLFSLINNVVTVLKSERYRNVHIDWSNGTLYSPQGMNLWEKLFRPTRIVADPSGDPTDNEGCIDILETYTDQWLTYKNAAELYCHPCFYEMRKKLHDIWQSLGLRFDIERKCRLMAESVGMQDGPYLSVLVRTGNSSGEQPSGQLQSLERYLEAIERVRISEEQPVFIGCSDKETLRWFCGKARNCRWNPHTKRSKTRATETHLESQHSVEDAIECIVDVFTMSRASHFIHPCSNMATAALYMNPNLQHTYLP